MKLLIGGWGTVWSEYEPRPACQLLCTSFLFMCACVCVCVGVVCAHVCCLSGPCQCQCLPFYAFVYMSESCLLPMLLLVSDFFFSFFTCIYIFVSWILVCALWSRFFSLCLRSFFFLIYMLACLYYSCLAVYCVCIICLSVTVFVCSIFLRPCLWLLCFPVPFSVCASLSHCLTVIMCLFVYVSCVRYHFFVCIFVLL